MIIISCKDKTNYIGNIIEDKDIPGKSMDDLISEIINFSDTSTYKFKILETTVNSLIGSFDKVVIRDDRIYVIDKSIKEEVYMFDNNGKFIINIS